MQIHLVLPGLLWPGAPLLSPTAGLELPALERLLGLGQRRLLAFEPYEHQLSRRFGLGTDPLPLAALRRQGEALPPADGHWLCADPVNLSFAREHLLLNAFRPGDIGDDEAATLIAALNDTFADLGRFEAAAGNRWYLRLDAPTRCLTVPVNDVVGRPIKLFLPEGEDARRWQRTMNEAQILLHNHALNEARSASGRAPINSLWLWGNGTLDAPLQPPLPAMQAGDPLALGLARAAGLQAGPPDVGRALQADTLVVLDALREPALQLDLEPWRAALTRLERDWFAPLAGALARGRLQRLTLSAAGDRGTLELEVTASARWKFWRKPLPLNSLLQSLQPAPTLPPQ